MATINVDGKKYIVNRTNNLLQACLSIGIDIPYFCWHPALGSVGSCRQCAVKQFRNHEDKHGHIVMSCMTPAIDGTLISINDKEAKEFRKSMIELLMINHPHDCPVCEEGGHCHLQDMTVMTKHRLRRYRFTKRTHYNQYLGPFITHEMNRCITCYRCVRYYVDYANGSDFGVYGMHDNIYFGRVEHGTLENEFSGNLVEICPTGVFTDKTYSDHYTRKWDMQFSPSICQQCCVGCNTSPGERAGLIRRIENRYNSTINHYFLCDRGRFGYGYVNRKDRPFYPKILNDNNSVILNADEAIKESAKILSQSENIIGIGSPRASIESNFALRKLVGSNNFSTGISAKEQEQIELIIKILQDSGIYTPSLREIESYDAILILGEDVTQVSARIALAIRQAIKGKCYEIAKEQKIENWQTSAIFNISQHNRYPLFITNVDKTNLDDIATWSYYAPVEDQARLGFAIANALNNTAPVVHDFDCNLNDKLNLVVQSLRNSKKPLIISGTHSGIPSIIESAANIAKALKISGSEVGIVLVTEYVNSIGVCMIGGDTLDVSLNKLRKEQNNTLIILENDLYRVLPKLIVDRALDNANNIVVIDHQNTTTLMKGKLILSTASFAESDGTVINYEGRAQRFFQVYDPSHYNKNIIILESWKWLYAINSILENKNINFTQLDKIIDLIEIELPQFNGIRDVAPNANFRINGQKLSRSPHRISGRTSILSNINVHEPSQPQDHDTMFSFSMEGNNQPNAKRSYIPFSWAPGWNSLQSWNKFQCEIGGPLRNGDPGIRLFEPKDIQLPWFGKIPNSFSQNRKDNSLRVAPYYQLFGSEEMTQRSPDIQKRMSKPILVMNSNDAVSLGIKNGTTIEFICLGEKQSLSVVYSHTLHSGLIGLPLGLPGIPPFLINSEIDKLQEAAQ